MPLVVDTFNVLHTEGVLPPELAGVDIGGLMALIQQSRYDREPAVLVCDGRRPPDAPRPATDGTIRLRFSGPGRIADELIMGMIRRSTAPRRLIVVSSDREIRRAARARRCRVLTSEDFLQHLARDVTARRNRRSTAGEVPASLATLDRAYWIREFGLEDAWLNLPSSENRPDDTATEPPAPRTPERAPDDPSTAMDRKDVEPGRVNGRTDEVLEGLDESTMRELFPDVRRLDEDTGEDGKASPR